MADRSDALSLTGVGVGFTFLLAAIGLLFPGRLWLATFLFGVGVAVLLFAVLSSSIGRRLELPAGNVLGLVLFPALTASFVFAAFNRPQESTHSNQGTTTASLPGGYKSLNRFHVYKEDPTPFQVGCPGRKCYRFELGEMVQTVDLNFAQQLFLSGEGFVRKVTGPGWEGYEAKIIVDGSMEVPIPTLDGRVPVLLPVTTGKKVEIFAEDANVIVLVEDDSMNSLTVAVATYPSTMCEELAAMPIPPSSTLLKNCEIYGRPSP